MLTCHPCRHVHGCSLASPAAAASRGRSSARRSKRHLIAISYRTKISDFQLKSCSFGAMLSMSIAACESPSQLPGSFQRTPPTLPRTSPGRCFLPVLALLDVHDFALQHLRNVLHGNKLKRKQRVCCKVRVKLLLTDGQSVAQARNGILEQFVRPASVIACGHESSMPAA